VLHQHLVAGDTDSFIGELWGRSFENRLAGLPRQARTLRADDQLVYLVRRGAVQRLLESPVWLNDVHYLIESEDFRREADWERIAWSLAEARALSGTWLVLNLLASEWGTRVPPEALAETGQELGGLRKRLLRRWAHASAWFSPAGRSPSWEFRSRFLLRDRALDALRPRSYAPAISGGRLPR
jgi:hypothetical protein